MNNIEKERERLSRSLLEFIQDFYYIRTGRRFELSFPTGRESHYLTICRALVRVMKGQTTRLVINVPPRYGKAIATNTAMLTRNGWTTAGQIKEGDELVGSDGWVKVTAVYPQGILSSKEVIFNDGQSVICNEEHLWGVYDRYTPKLKIKRTSEIEETLHEADGRKHWRIPLVKGDFGLLTPSIDPYLFGCWLGDGHSHYSAITSMDEDIIQAFRDAGYILNLHKHQSAGKAKTYGVTKGFSKILRELNQFKNKHIPEEVALWSKEDRLALLQGLMDTDGTCGKNGQVSFTNINQSIIDGCGFLVNSLGGTYRIYTRKCGTQTLNIRLPDELSLFRLQRKKQYISAGVKCAPRRFIEAIIDANPTEMVCFTVDSDDHLFAVSTGLILTHNTECLIHFVAWALAQYPDANFLYVSYSLGLAKKQTKTIRQIVGMKEFQDIFDVSMSDDTSAQGNFETNYGGTVFAAGADGEITGRGAGIKGAGRFGGAIVIDDIHKPSEVSSETMRNNVNEWYFNTLQSRLNEPDKTPIIFIGQRLHEDDLAANLIKSGEWETVIIPALDATGNALHPQMHDKTKLLHMQETMPYVFSSQYQQDPLPAGGGIFKPEWFYQTDEEPKILATFITADTAETSKDYNDASVFSFWGIYKISHGDQDTEMMALHWLDCVEMRIEPKDLERAFMQFYTQCMRYPVKPRVAAIEKKSSGVTLLSVLSGMRGLQIMDIERTMASGGKTTRFLEIQPIVASKQVSIPKEGRHTALVIEHMRKITANNSHRFDDIADTLYDAIKLAIIDNLIAPKSVIESVKDETIARTVMGTFSKVMQLRNQRYLQ